MTVKHPNATRRNAAYAAEEQSFCPSVFDIVSCGRCQNARGVLG